MLMSFTTQSIKIFIFISIESYFFYLNAMLQLAKYD